MLKKYLITLHLHAFWTTRNHLYCLVRLIKSSGFVLPRRSCLCLNLHLLLHFHLIVFQKYFMATICWILKNTDSKWTHIHGFIFATNLPFALWKNTTYFKIFSNRPSWPWECSVLYFFKAKNAVFLYFYVHFLLNSHITLEVFIILGVHFKWFSRTGFVSGKVQYIIHFKEQQNIILDQNVFRMVFQEVFDWSWWLQTQELPKQESTMPLVQRTPPGDTILHQPCRWKKMEDWENSSLQDPFHHLSHRVSNPSSPVCGIFREGLLQKMERPQEGRQGRHQGKAWCWRWWRWWCSSSTDGHSHRLCQRQGGHETPRGVLDCKIGHTPNFNRIEPPASHQPEGPSHDEPELRNTDL